jgi:hypothetical protein
VDNGVAGDGSTAPSTNTTGYGAAVECASLRDKTVQFGGTFSSTNQLQGTIDGVNWLDDLGALQDGPWTAAAVVFLGNSWMSIRNHQTAFSSGNPTVTLCGHEER